ncbi:uncharacterized protein [Antedon mediterranea]|uniref:uncharacterized protein n=1 Tax=Antedon mediterranea TaxID=105859 RepID=UPI003AF7BB3A
MAKELIIAVISAIIGTALLYKIFSMCYKKFCKRQYIDYVPDDSEHGDNVVFESDCSETCGSNLHIKDTDFSEKQDEDNERGRKPSNSLLRRIGFPNFIHIGMKLSERRVSHGARHLSTFNPSGKRKDDTKLQMEKNPLAIEDQDNKQNTDDNVSQRRCGQEHENTIQQVFVEVHKPSVPLDISGAKVIEHEFEDLYLTPMIGHESINFHSKISNHLSKSEDILHKKVDSKSSESMEQNFKLTSDYKQRDNMLPSASMDNLPCTNRSPDEFEKGLVYSRPKESYLADEVQESPVYHLPNETYSSDNNLADQIQENPAYHYHNERYSTGNDSADQVPESLVYHLPNDTFSTSSYNTYSDTECAMDTADAAVSNLEHDTYVPMRPTNRPIFDMNECFYMNTPLDKTFQRRTFKDIIKKK